jgi:hypothetical protein
MPLTITREIRDLLHSEARRTLDAPDTVGLARPDLTTVDGAALAQRQARRLQRAFTVLDHLGWAEKDDREQYELPIEEIIIEWLKTTDTEIHLRLVELDTEIYEQKAGNEDYFHDGCSREESMAITQEEISQELGIAGVTNELLERIFEPVLGSTLEAAA